MRSVWKIFLLISFIFCFENCSNTEPEYSEIRFSSGTVKYLSFEGGFYGIVTDDNRALDPINLPKEFQIEGKRVFLKYRSKLEGASFHMWGEIIEIIEIREL